jgi:hypothetical protein
MTDGWVLVPRELVRFLLGETAFDGLWFGDIPRYVKGDARHGQFWWRHDLRAALAAAPPVDGWQPIETAPRDETKVLLWSDGGAVFGSWRVDKGYASKKPMWLDESYDDFSCGFASVPLDPTHWMPLPQPPNNERTPG